MKTLFKRDHYETEIVLDCNNCEILKTDQEWTYLKVDESILNKLNEIKRQINTIVNRNPEFYQNCTRVIQHKKTFEETLVVKTNGFAFNENTYNIKVLLYRININKSSYGPVLKIIETEPVNFKENGFVDFLEENSDDEIHDHFETFNVKNVKSVKSVKNVKSEKSLKKRQKALKSDKTV
jgi:hypothetical protein